MQIRYPVTFDGLSAFKLERTNIYYDLLGGGGGGGRKGKGLEGEEEVGGRVLFCDTSFRFRSRGIWTVHGIGLYMKDKHLLRDRR